MALPTEIHGYPVVAAKATPADRSTRAGAVILVDRGEGRYQRYVTGWLGEGDSNWAWGHYCETLDEANADFERRCRRGY